MDFVIRNKDKEFEFCPSSVLVDVKHPHEFSEYGYSRRLNKYYYHFADGEINIRAEGMFPYESPQLEGLYMVVYNIEVPVYMYYKPLHGEAVLKARKVL